MSAIARPKTFTYSVRKVWVLPIPGEIIQRNVSRVFRDSRC
jgi:hypothetical protein